MTLPWNALRRNLSRGVETLSWMARFVADRTMKEARLVRTAYEARLFEERIDTAYRAVGERLAAVRHREHPLADSELQELLDNVDRLASELDDHVARVGEMQGVFAEGDGTGGDGAGDNGAESDNAEGDPAGSGSGPRDDTAG